jgi:hypothetical protein
VSLQQLEPRTCILRCSCEYSPVLCFLFSSSGIMLLGREQIKKKATRNAVGLIVVDSELHSVLEESRRVLRLMLDLSTSLWLLICQANQNVTRTFASRNFRAIPEYPEEVLQDLLYDVVCSNCSCRGFVSLGINKHHPWHHSTWVLNRTQNTRKAQFRSF